MEPRVNADQRRQDTGP